MCVQLCMTKDHKLLHQLDIHDGQVVQVRLGSASVGTSSVSAPSPGTSRLPEVRDNENDNDFDTERRYCTEFLQSTHCAATCNLV